MQKTQINLSIIIPFLLSGLLIVTGAIISSSNPSLGAASIISGLIAYWFTDKRAEEIDKRSEYYGKKM